QCISDSREDLTRGFFLPAFNLTEVSKRNTRLTGYLTQGATLLQPEVAQHVAEFLTNQYHRILLFSWSPAPLLFSPPMQSRLSVISLHGVTESNRYFSPVIPEHL